MINAVLYSDQGIPANEKIDARLVAIMKARGRRVGYIPAGPDRRRRLFSLMKAHYLRYGLDFAIFHDPDHPHSRAELDALLACDAIHLSGGDTTRFLLTLRRSGLLDLLRTWAQNGGVLIGTSAGAIMMTPTIAVDALFQNERPEDVKDGAALHLLPFEFFPHLQAEPGYLRALIAYSAHNSRPILACRDGEGVVVTEGRVECIGDVLRLFDGTITRDKTIPLERFNP